MANQWREFVPAREIAWNGDGKWCGAGAEVEPRPELVLEHQCGELGEPRAECGRFVCSHCQRCVPWCFGGEGTLCDDCWCEIRLPRIKRAEERLEHIHKRRREQV